MKIIDMTCRYQTSSDELQALDVSRRRFLKAATAAGLAMNVKLGELFAAGKGDEAIATADRFPHFRSEPVSYFHVRMKDRFWAPRQETVRDVTLPWATSHWDAAGGLDAYRADPSVYRARLKPGDMEAIKFIEAMAAVVGLQRDAAVEGLIETWARFLIDLQGADGYLQAGFGVTLSHPPERWAAFSISHETYLIGHYLEAAIACRESTGGTALYDSAIRAIDNMADALLDSGRPYISGVPEIEQALMRLFGATGRPEYLRLCGWFIAQRGNHVSRASGGKPIQDHLPVQNQRTIEGHAVCAAYLFNGVTEYVGATGDEAYREAVLSIWDDLAEHKMYLHGASGNVSSNFEGYLPEPYNISPYDTYGESCAIFGNFQWAHSLFRLTGEARYLDFAERMLYNAFYASLSLQGDSYFYRNVSQTFDPKLRYDWHPVPCCPPNIVKLLCKIGGFFYSMDRDGIFVKHYGASEADIPFGKGVKLIQQGDYPWDGDISLQVEPSRPARFALRLRIPAWTKAHSVTVNGQVVQGDVRNGWLTIYRYWRTGDRIELSLPMRIERVTMPPRFKGYENLAALRRGPIVYCVEQKDSPAPIGQLYFPPDAKFTAEHRPDLLGGVTVLKGKLPQATTMYVSESPVPVMFIPYGVWNNRKPGAMSIWLSTKPHTLNDDIKAWNDMARA